MNIHAVQQFKKSGYGSSDTKINFYFTYQYSIIILFTCYILLYIIKKLKINVFTGAINLYNIKTLFQMVCENCTRHYYRYGDKTADDYWGRFEDCTNGDRKTMKPPQACPVGRDSTPPTKVCKHGIHCYSEKCDADHPHGRVGPKGKHHSASKVCVHGIHCYSKKCDADHPHGRVGPKGKPHPTHAHPMGDLVGDPNPFRVTPSKAPPVLHAWT